MEVVNTSEFDPIHASETILTAVERYLSSNFKPRRKSVADEYAAAVAVARDSHDIGGSLYLESRRPFAVGASLQTLIAAGTLHSRLATFMPQQPYAHQSRAITAACEGRNVVIATGTGSGKTESFLAPIVDALMREHDAGTLTPGIRAILIYPMNALATDQLGRIRDTLTQYPEISFGRFVGPTVTKQAEAIRANNGKPFPANERPSRESMLESPPHILITNYAMLERLLLLPKWAPLFTGDLRWIVLDEVHSYDGTKGIEIGLLLRRLKARTAADAQVRCIAASATLGNGSSEDLQRAASFAGSMFGEPFAPTEVVLPDFDPNSPETPLVDVFDARNRAALTLAQQQPTGAYHLFVRNPGGAFICLHPRHPAGKPRLRLQQRKFCEHCSLVGVSSRVVELGACGDCGIEYLIAKRSGGTLLAVDERDDSARFYALLSAPLPDWPQTDHDLSDILIDANDDDDVVSGVTTLGWYCPECATISSTPTCGACSAACVAQFAEELALDAQGRLRCVRCGNDGGRSPFGPVARPVSGPDALTSVIATALYDTLPSDELRHGLHGGGRKLLSFSDSRQDAAYFAPYLADTYFDLLRRRALYAALASLYESPYQMPPFTLQHLAAALTEMAGEFEVTPDDSLWAWAWIRAELVGVDLQQSLAGVGLLRWFIRRQDLQHSLAVLQGRAVTADQAFELLMALLDTARYDGAVELPRGIPADHALFAPKQTLPKLYKIGKRPKSGASLAWVSEASQGNRRTDMLQRGMNLDPDEARLVLASIWDALIADDILEDVGAGQFVLRNRVLRVAAVDRAPEFIQYWCPACRAYANWRLPNGQCLNKRCDGLPVVQASPAQDHYRQLALTMPLKWLTAKEHTAQWTPQQAEIVQGEFIDGKVNVLSCSTTFEMGVDIGEVSAVLCRNVPPTPANYVQRAGRAGRRSGTRALTVTFARRRSHDAQYAADPTRLIKGRIPVPSVVIDNPDLIRRHLYALALSQFLRTRDLHVERAGEFFLTETDQPTLAAQFASWLQMHPASIREEIQQLQLPTTIADVVGISTWAWVDLLLTPDDDGIGGWLTAVQDMFQTEDRDLRNWIEEFKKLLEGPRPADVTRKLVKAYRVQEDLQRRQLVEILANGGVLPKYGFPVDVAALTPNYQDQRSGQGRGIELTRDLSIAITEYAPGSQVVAGGSLVTSTGVKRPINVEFGSLRWVAVTCDSCGWFFHKRAPFQEEFRPTLPQDCGHCGLPLSGDTQTFYEPRFGFLAKVDPKSAGAKSRPKRANSARVYLSTQDHSDAAWRQHDAYIQTSVSRDARLLALGRNDFWMCLSCGYAAPMPTRADRGAKTPPPKHEDPRRPDRLCEKQLTPRVHFGHQYRTDVLELRLMAQITHGCPCGEADCQGPLDSLAAALVAGAVRVLGVASTDLNAAVTSRQLAGMKRVMLFDTNPGGAGLARLADERLSEVLRAAKAVVANCTCEAEASCYGCLRNYNNQWRHEHLSRASALALLDVIGT